MRINRNSIVEDVLNFFEKLSNNDITKKLFVKFIGEEGIDSGALTSSMYREFFTQIFNEKYGLFKVKNILKR